jgi:hypothetical protein
MGYGEIVIEQNALRCERSKLRLDQVRVGKQNGHQISHGRVGSREVCIFQDNLARI